jgi:hypothetical protein
MLKKVVRLKSLMLDVWAKGLFFCLTLIKV